MYLIDYNKLFEDFFETPKTKTATSTHKQVVVDINDDILRIGLAVPGQTKETLEITIEENFIKVKSIEKETDDAFHPQDPIPEEESVLQKLEEKKMSNQFQKILSF